MNLRPSISGAPSSLVACLGLTGGGMITILGAGGKTSLMFRLAQLLSAAGDSVLTTTTTKIFIPSQKQSPTCIVSSNPADLILRLRSLRITHNHVTAAAGTDPSGKKLIGPAPETLDAIDALSLFQWIIVEGDGAAGRPIKAPAAHEPVIPSRSRWVISVTGMDAVGRPLAEAHVFRSRLFGEISGLTPCATVTEAAIASAMLHPHGMFKNAPDSARRIVLLNKVEGETRLSSARNIAANLRHHPNFERIDRICAASLQAGYCEILNGE